MYLSFIDYAKPLVVWIITNWKILKEVWIPDHFTCLLRNLYAGPEVTEPDMEQKTNSKLGKEYIKAVYCHPDYFPLEESERGEGKSWLKTQHSKNEDHGIRSHGK